MDCERYVKQIDRVRRSIEHFEKHADTKGDLSRFYDSMLASLALAGDLEVLRLKRHEKAILRGNDSSFDGGGASTQTQREVVRHVRLSMREDPNLGKNAAVRQAMDKYNVTRNQVFKFLTKY